MNISYYEGLEAAEREQVTAIIQTLLEQTYLLEYKYDRKHKKMEVNPYFRICDQHLSFLKDYFEVGGFQLREDIGNGVIYLTGGENVIGSRLSEYTTKFLLILRVIYDERMSSASTNHYVITSRAEVQEKMDGFHLLSKQPTTSEVRAAMRMLKKYQIIGMMESGDEEELDARFLIYPSIQMLLLGENVRSLVDSYCEETIEKEGIEKERRDGEDSGAEI